MNNATEVTITAIQKRYKKKSRFWEVWNRMKKNRISMLGLAIFAVIIFCTIFAFAIVPYNMALQQNIAIRLQPPSAAHWFGTDAFGRDMFARIIWGTRNSLVMGIGAVIVGISLGGLFGAVTGYYGGIIDMVTMRTLESIMCIPFMLLALAIVAALGPGLVNVMLALMLSMVPYYTRVIRSAILTVNGQDFIEAARACGAPDRLIIVKHILPNAIGPVIVQATMSVGSMIIWAAAMSFLGMGIQPPTPEWGSMLAESQDYMLSAPHLMLFPGLAIVLTALSVNLMGDGLRDALDPRLKD